MRILVAHPISGTGVGFYAVRALRAMGHEVKEFNLKPSPYFTKLFDSAIRYGNAESIWHAINYEKKFRGPIFFQRYMYGRSLFTPSFGFDSSYVMKKCGTDYDIFLAIEGWGNSIRNIEKFPMPTVFWAIDPHAHLAPLLSYAKAFDIIFVAQKKFVADFRNLGKPAYWLPNACDPKIHKKFNVAKKFDIIFVGELTSERKKFFDTHNIRIDLFSGVYGKKMAKLYSKSKIVFNIDRFAKPVGDLNMRFFETLSTGSMLLTNEADGREDLFTNKKHLVIYDEKNLKELADYYLEHDEEREKIAAEGMREVHTKHTYIHRMKYLLDHIS